MPEDELPTRVSHGDGPPAPRAWADKDPVAARRLDLAKVAIAKIAEEHSLPLENLLTPDTLRRTMWTPPRTREPVELLEAVIDQLHALGARSWQVGLTAPALSRAILDAEAPKRQSRSRSSVAEEDADDEAVPDGDVPSDEPSDGASDGS